MARAADPRTMSLTLLEASLRNPNLARLQALMKDSSLYLTQVRHLIPTSLRTTVKAGPIESATPESESNTTGKISWCLIAGNNASASKLRQLLPTLLQHLQDQGHPVASIRLSIEKAPPAGGRA